MPNRLTSTVLLAVSVASAQDLTTSQGRENQIIINTQRIENVMTRQAINEGRIGMLESRVTTLEMGENKQDMTTSTILIRMEDLTQLVHWAIGLLIALFVAFAGRIAYDVVSSRRIRQ